MTTDLATVSSTSASRSPSELCRYIRNADPTQVPLARLENELARDDILNQMRLKENDDSKAVVPAQPLPRIKTISERLGLPYPQALHLVTQYVRQRHTSSAAEPDPAALFAFYHQERCQLYMLIAVLLQTSGNATHPYCSVARNVISRCGDLLSAALERYRSLAQVTTAPVLSSPDLVRVWADDVVQQQALLMQIVLAHLSAVRGAPSDAQVTAMLDLYGAQQVSGGWPLYTLLSAEGRRLSRTLAALWLQVFLCLLQPKALVVGLLNNGDIGEFHAALNDPIALDERIFRRLSLSQPESGPVLLSWAVYLCLLYQCLNRGVPLPGMKALGARPVADLQNRVLVHLAAAVRLEVFTGMRSLLALIDADHHLDVAAVLARGALHDLMSALARSDVQNVLVRALPDYFDAHLAPLYEALLQRLPDGNPELSECIWIEIEEAFQADAPSSFPLFENAFHRFREAMAERRLVALPSVQFAECRVLLRLLSVLVASPTGSERALRILEVAEPNCLSQLQALFGSVVSGGLFGVADCFLLEFAKFTLQVVVVQEPGSGLGAVMLPPPLIESVCIALHSIKLDPASASTNSGALVDTLLGLLCHVPRYDAALNRQLQRFAFPDLAHLFLYQVDAGSGAFRCTIHVVRLLERILAQSEVDLHFPLDEYAALCRRLIDFVCDDVFVIYDSWRFASDAARWALGEAIFALFASLLASDDLRSQLLLRGQIGHRLALRLCNETAMQRVLFHPIVAYRDHLAFGSPTRVKDAVSGLVSAAFRVVQSLLAIRTTWPPAPFNDSLLDTCFRSGLDSARLAQTFVLYLDLPEYQWAHHAIVVLTRLVDLSALMNRTFAVTIVGLLSQSRAVDAHSSTDGQVTSLKEAVGRLLKLDVAFLQSAALEFLVTALRHQPGLAERLLEGTSGPNLLAHLHELLEKKRDNVVVFEQALSVFAELWLAAVRYRSVSTSMIADRAVQEFGELFWAAVGFPLRHAIAAESGLIRLASLRAQSHAFQILSIEFAYANDLSASSAVVTGQPFEAWLQDLLPTPEQWASLSGELRDAMADAISKWKQFLNAILLNAATLVGDHVRARLRSALIERVLSLEGVPLSVVKDSALLLVALNYHTNAPLSDDDLAALIHALQLHAAAFENGARVQTPDLSVYALICDSILSVFNLQVIRHGGQAAVGSALPPLWPDDIVRVAARLAALDQTGFIARQLPGLVQHCSLNAVAEVVAAIQSLSGRLLSTKRPANDGFARLKIFLMFVMSISVHPRGSDVLVSIGVLSAISNSWLRASIGDLMRRHSELWCLILDIATALLIASPTSQSLHRQIVEFAVVFRHQLQVTVKEPLDADNLQLVHRCMVFCYEIGHIAGRFRNMPTHIIDEQRTLQCQTAFTLACQITSSTYSAPQQFAREQWLAIQALSVVLAFLRSQQARTLAGLFSFDLKARSNPQPGSLLPISFVVDLIDYCIGALQSETCRSVAFVKERLVAFDQIHRFILEHALFILVDFTTFHIRMSARSSPYLADYLQEFTRIRRALESAQVLAESDDSFLSERIMGPVLAIEGEIQRLVLRKSSGSNGAMELDSGPQWQSHSLLLRS